MTTKQPATPLPWAVFNRDGKLLARMESESEAYYYIRNRGHANGGTYRNDGDHAANAYPKLVEALQHALAVRIGIHGDIPANESWIMEAQRVLRELGEAE